MNARSRGWSLPPVPVLALVPCAGELPLRVHPLVAPLFLELIRLMELGTYKGFMTCSGGYNYRAKRGRELQWKNSRNPDDLSNHAFGLAGDFRAGTNPGYRSRTTDIPPALARESAAACGLSWGGDWDDPYDPMHWEFLGTPAQARAWTTIIVERRIRETVMGWNDQQIATVVRAAEAILRSLDTKHQSLVNPNDPRDVHYPTEFLQFIDKATNETAKNTAELLRRIPPK